MSFWCCCFFLGDFVLSKVMAEVMKSIKPHLTDVELQELFASDSLKGWLDPGWTLVGSNSTDLKLKMHLVSLSIT